MDANHCRGRLLTRFVIVATFIVWSAAAAAQSQSEYPSRWWVSGGLGGASFSTPVPAPSARRKAIAASIDFGYRLTPELGLGLEFGTTVPVDGCAGWECAGSAAEFAPAFTRMFAFGEFRPRDSGWRFRAGAGVSRFCYSRHWSDSAWGWGDTLDVMLTTLLEDDPVDTFGGSGGYRCDARMKALGGAVSMGYDWPVKDGAPLSVGLRLTAEAANFGRTPVIDLPAVPSSCRDADAASEHQLAP